MKSGLFFVMLFLVMNCFGQPPENSNSINGNINEEVGVESEPVEEDVDIATDSTHYRNDELKKEGRKQKFFQNKDSYNTNYSNSHIQSKQVLETESKRSKFQSNSRSPSPQSQKIMDAEVESLRQVDDQSFDYHLYNYVSGNYDVTRQESLYRAEAINGNNHEVQRLMVANSLVMGDLTGAGIGLTKLVNNGTLSKETVAYTDDVLKSSKGNEILFTHGTNDTYGTVYNQYMNPDEYNSICIVSLDLMKSASYRTILKNKGIQLPSREFIDVQFFKDLCVLNANKGISISMTFPIDYLKPLADQLVPYGLVLRMGKQKPLCATDLEHLWNNNLNKKNLIEYNSSESRGYAKNYAPTKAILKNFHESQKSNHYMESIKDQKSTKGKLDKKH